MVCSDKTGTLTENLMEVTDIYTASCQHAVVINGASEPQLLCKERTVIPETHPDIIRVVEVSNVSPYYSQVLLTINGCMFGSAGGLCVQQCSGEGREGAGPPNRVCHPLCQPQSETTPTNLFSRLLLTCNLSPPPTHTAWALQPV